MEKTEKLAQAIKETLWLIEKDLDPFIRGDVMSYSGYLEENTGDLCLLVAKLINEIQGE
jgi:hypothetical protein